MTWSNMGSPGVWDLREAERDRALTAMLPHVADSATPPGSRPPIELRAIVRYDWESGALVRYAVPPGDQNSEPVFVPRRRATAEDDRWLLCCVYRHATDTSDVVVLDARDLARPKRKAVHNTAHASPRPRTPCHPRHALW
ncbi:Dioxygenase (modular protein) [Paraburkholderia kururiensis]